MWLIKYIVFFYPRRAEFDVLNGYGLFINYIQRPDGTRARNIIFIHIRRSRISVHFFLRLMCAFGVRTRNYSEEERTEISRINFYSPFFVRNPCQ